MICGIYKITENETGRCYIGQSKDVAGRWKKHQKKQYPLDKFSYEVIMECDYEQLSFWEIAWIASERSAEFGFNKTVGGNAWGWKDPEATRAKMSAATKGKNNRKGIPHSEETRAKISEGNRRRPPRSDETRRKMSEARKGKKFGPLSDEHRAKLSAAAKLREQNKYLRNRSVEDNCSENEGPQTGTSQANTNP